MGSVECNCEHNKPILKSMNKECCKERSKGKDDQRIVRPKKVKED